MGGNKTAERMRDKRMKMKKGGKLAKESGLRAAVPHGCTPLKTVSCSGGQSVCPSVSVCLSFFKTKLGVGI